MSDNERSEAVAFREFETLVRHLGEELANFRRRALQAENQLKAAEAHGTGPAVGARATALDAENAVLRGRLEGAAKRARVLLDRVRFLRQQADRGGNR